MLSNVQNKALLDNVIISWNQCSVKETKAHRLKIKRKGKRDKAELALMHQIRDFGSEALHIAVDPHQFPHLPIYTVRTCATSSSFSVKLSNWRGNIAHYVLADSSKCKCSASEEERKNKNGQQMFVGKLNVVGWRRKAEGSTGTDWYTQTEQTDTLENTMCYVCSSNKFSVVETEPY